MKLLILTQKVDRRDVVLGFFHRWIIEFASQCESVIVLALEVGEYDLPANVRVLSLGKDKGVGKFGYLKNFFRTIVSERKHYDTVFVHMNPIYAALAGWYWRLTGKRVGMWYTHRSIDLKLRIATLLVNVIFSASKEGFRLRTDKAHFLGHGIDVDVFAGVEPKKDEDSPFTMLSVGRITPIKHCETIIRAARLVKDELGRKVELIFLGEPATDSDADYMRKLETIVKEESLTDEVFFPGGMRPEEVRRYYASSDVTINMPPTGGMDKVVLEAIASGVPTVTSNATFATLYGDFAPRFITKEQDADDLAEKVTAIARADDLTYVTHLLRERVRETTSLPKLISKIVHLIKQSP